MSAWRATSRSTRRRVRQGANQARRPPRPVSARVELAVANREVAADDVGSACAQPRANNLQGPSNRPTMWSHE
jgi:hypothetical protein